MANEWRAILALLANPDARPAIGRWLLGDDGLAELGRLSPSRQAHLRDRLEASGMLRDGAFDPTVFACVLAADAPARRTGIHRFIDEDRLHSYPAGAADRAEVLTWLAATVLAESEELDERSLTARLAERTPDAASFRRYLVDAGLLIRDAAGRRYRRGPTASVGE